MPPVSDRAEHPAQQPGPRGGLLTLGKPNCGPGLLQRLVRRNRCSPTERPLRTRAGRRALQRRRRGSPAAQNDTTPKPLGSDPAEHPAQQPGPPGGTAPREGLTAAPVCCSGWFGTDCTRIRPREPDYRIRAPAATAPRPDGHAGPPPRPLPDEPPDQHRLRPSPPPTTPNALASSLADNYMSATEGQQPVGGGVPNTPLSSRGRGATEHLGKPDCGPGLLQRMVRRNHRPPTAAATPARPRPTKPGPTAPATRLAPAARERHNSDAPCQRPSRTPRSAAGAAGELSTARGRHAAPVCCSGWFGV